MDTAKSILFGGRKKSVGLISLFPRVFLQCSVVGGSAFSGTSPEAVRAGMIGQTKNLHAVVSSKTVMVIPAHNEARFIGKAVDAARWHLSAMTKNWVIVVVEDGSTDGTPTILSNISSQDKHVVYLHSKKRQGRGLAVRKAMSLFNGESDVFCFMDADLATDMRALSTLIKKVEAGYDLVTGSRYVDGSRVARPLLRMLVSKGYNLMIRLVFHDSVTDHQCGFKAFSKRLVKDVLPECTSPHWFWDTEVIIRSQAKGLKITEVPIEWQETRNHRTPLVRLLKDIAIHGAGLLSLWFDLRSGSTVPERTND